VVADDGAARIVPLKRRREFLRIAAEGRKWVTPAFVLQAGRRPAEGAAEAAAPAIGIGFTASRRVGKAVARNRARRRLREAVRRVLPGPARPGFDYVVVARPAVRRRGPARARPKKARSGLDPGPGGAPK
jgi:ribonuclease P protein component